MTRLGKSSKNTRGLTLLSTRVAITLKVISRNGLVRVGQGDDHLVGRGRRRQHRDEQRPAGAAATG